MKRTNYFACKASGKRAWRSRAEAERVLARCRRVATEGRRKYVNRAMRAEYRVYHCEFCGGWHLSSRREWSEVA